MDLEVRLWNTAGHGWSIQQQCLDVGIGRSVGLGTELDQLGELGAERRG